MITDILIGISQRRYDFFESVIHWSRSLCSPAVTTALLIFFPPFLISSNICLSLRTPYLVHHVIRLEATFILSHKAAYGFRITTLISECWHWMDTGCLYFQRNVFVFNMYIGDIRLYDPPAPNPVLKQTERPIVKCSQWIIH